MNMYITCNLIFQMLLMFLRDFMFKKYVQVKAARSWIIEHLLDPLFMYRQYSVHKETSVAFKWTRTTKYGQYSFVGVDACPNVGLKRPYNFFGVLHEVTRCHTHTNE